MCNAQASIESISYSENYLDFNNIISINTINNRYKINCGELYIRNTPSVNKVMQSV